MAEQKKRIYKYDNVKAFLIFLVVIGHMTTDYVSDSHMIRWVTLWIYSFHMPAFIFLSGLVHKQYISEARAQAGVRGETRMRWDKVAGFFLCGYALKVFLQLSRTLMGQNPLWHWIEEPGIPWYLFVMAEYELLFYVMRLIDGGSDASAEKSKKPVFVIIGAFALSAVIGYFPAVGDIFCLSRMINFLPIYALGYYMDMRKTLDWFEGRGYGTAGNIPDRSPDEIRNRKALMRFASWAVIIASALICYNGKWGLYSWRKWFTGRRSYEFLQDFFSNALSMGWLIRLAVWGIALILTFAILAVIPDRDLGPVTVAGQRTLQVYFWHRPVCYLFRTLHVLPSLVVMFGGTYDEALYGPKAGLAFGGSNGAMIAGFIVYLLIGLAMTGLFSLNIFEHPTTELMKLGARIGELCRRSE
jgi:fucose 4-O-acetylase-like acetyltransferase